MIGFAGNNHVSFPMNYDGVLYMFPYNNPMVLRNASNQSSFGQHRPPPSGWLMLGRCLDLEFLQFSWNPTGDKAAGEWLVWICSNICLHGVIFLDNKFKSEVVHCKRVAGCFFAEGTISHYHAIFSFAGDRNGPVWNRVPPTPPSLPWFPYVSYVFVILARRSACSDSHQSYQLVEPCWCVPIAP